MEQNHGSRQSREVHMHTAMGLTQKKETTTKVNALRAMVCQQRKVQTKRANPTPGGAFQASKQASDLLGFLVMPLRDGVQAGCKGATDSRFLVNGLQEVAFEKHQQRPSM